MKMHEKKSICGGMKVVIALHHVKPTESVKLTNISLVCNAYAYT